MPFDIDIDIKMDCLPAIHVFGILFSINNELAALVSSSRIMVTKEGDNNPRPLDNGYG
jgi:hypothetical protein